MTIAQIQLRDDEAAALKRLAEQTGKTETELIVQAVEKMLSNISHEKRVEYLRQAKGMWYDHDALPSMEDLRREWDRNV